MRADITALTSAAAILLLLGSPGVAQRAEAIDRASLRVCADPDNPPLSVQDGSGLENRIAALFGQQLGVPVSYVWFPNGQGFFRNTLNLRRCDIVIGSPTGLDIAQGTIPYYRSTYVLVTRLKDAIVATHLSDSSLAGLAIGAQSGSPAIDALASAGLLDRLRAYPMTPEANDRAVAERMIDDLVARRTDAAIIWGPIGAYFAGQRPGLLRVTPLASGEAPSPLAFQIGMAVRFGEQKWRARVEDFIRTNQPALRAILESYRVPLLPLEPETAK